MVRKIYTLSLLTIVGTMLMLTTARAQMLSGDFMLHAVLDGGNVDLSWSAPEMFSVEYYLVYRAQVGVMDSSLNASYSLIDSTTATEYTDTTAPPPNTLFVYLVKAYNSTGQVRLSALAKVFVNFGDYHRDHVTITSTPPTDATVDSLYTYQVTAVSSDSTAVLQYHLGEHPPLMTIDSTGLISWTPLERGWREVEVIVASSKGGHAGQEYTVRVAGLDGKIAGIVTDTLGHPIPHTIVRLYQRNLMTAIPLMTPIAIEPFDYWATTDSTGHYLIRHVDAGRYLVRATPTNPNYLPEWYNNVESILNATPIVVSDTSSHVADFALHNRFFNLPKYVISGIVVDTLGNPVRGAWVVFARAGFVFNEAREDQEEWESGEDFRDFFRDAVHDIHEDHDFSLEGHSPYVYKTFVDSTGAYRDTLPEGNYVIFARAVGYYRTFYNNERGILNADIMKLVSDTTGINFTLIHYPPIALGEISGSVIDSVGSVSVASRLIAFRDIWNYRDTLKMHVAGVYFTDADSTGAYDFNDLPPGYYRILALPLGGYAPSFYSLTGPTVRWKDATAIQVNGNSTSGANIYVMPLPDSASGFTSIGGSVKISGSAASRGSGSLATLGVGGALVYATDANGNIAGYGVTDQTGSYTIAGLAPGSYNVFTDAVGYTSTGSSASSPSYDGNGNPAPSTTNFTVTPETPTAVEQNVVVPVNYSLEQNYPNPFNPTTQIAFSIPQTEHVTVTVFNILGQQMATLVDGNLGSGAHIITWNAKNENGELLPSGVYFYRLSTPGFTAVKKMLLLK
ncbi:MAG TPA: T9SS type A sorting domain-containing protein [Candidatus Kryptonia bacterium]